MVESAWILLRDVIPAMRAADDLYNLASAANPFLSGVLGRAGHLKAVEARLSDVKRELDLNSGINKMLVVLNHYFKVSGDALLLRMASERNQFYEITEEAYKKYMFTPDEEGDIFCGHSGVKWMQGMENEYETIFSRADRLPWTQPLSVIRPTKKLMDAYGSMPPFAPSLPIRGCIYPENRPTLI